MSLSSLNKNIYSDLKVFNYPHFINNLESGTNAPLHIRLKPTNKCNHHCSYCSYRNPKQTLGKDMNNNDFIPYKKMVSVIKDIISMGVKAITFSGGGEPTVYPKFDKILEILAGSPVKFALLTNGALFSGKIADIFAKNGSWVRISIDGWDRESYKKYRGVDDFDRVIRNIHNFKSDKCLLGVNIVVNRDNARHIYELYRILRNAKIDTIKISPCVIDDDIAKNEEYHKPIANIVESQIEKIRLESKININNNYQEQLGSFNKIYNWCPNIQMRPVIGADQNIYSCHDKAYEQKGLIGSFRDTSLRQAWEKVDKFKIDPSTDCVHHCMAHNKNQMVLSYLNIYKDHIEFV